MGYYRTLRYAGRIKWDIIVPYSMLGMVAPSYFVRYEGRW